VSAGLPPDAIERLSRFVAREDLERMLVVRERPWRWLPAGLRTGAVTFGRHVVFREGRFRPDTTRGLALIAHESGHIGQFREMGKPGFFLRYGLGLLRSRFRHDRHPMEAPLVSLQRDIRAQLEKED
jgi:hypothetical protein